MFDLGATLLAAEARDGSAAALIDGDAVITYGELADKARRMVSAFDELGLKQGERILIIMQNRMEMALLHWAAQLSGLVATPINWRAEASELDYFLENSNARAIFYEPISENAVTGSKLAGNLARVAYGGAVGHSHLFDDLLQNAPAQDVPRAKADDISLMLYTSGTTGQGKGVPRSHYNERAAAIAHIAQNSYKFGEVTLGVMPLYHTMGVRLLLSMALVNGTFVCLPRFDPRSALELIHSCKISALYLVPTLYHDLIEQDAFEPSKIASVTKLGFAGASMTDGLLKKLNDIFKPELFVNHYGSSEVYTFTIEQNAAAKPGSAGKAGINTEIRVVAIGSVDPDERVAIGEEGQIISSLEGDEAFAGYWNRPDANQKSLHQGWYFTGDIGFLDAAGDLFVTGRVDDMMITGGENVLPAEIESVLSLHPSVGEVAVVGLPDERWGQKVTAFICQAANAAEVTREELDAWCKNSELANFKRPRDYIFVSQIPKSPVGKILRRMLTAGEYSAQPASAPAQKAEQKQPSFLKRLFQ